MRAPRVVTDPAMDGSSCNIITMDFLLKRSGARDSKDEITTSLSLTSDHSKYELIYYIDML